MNTFKETVLDVDGMSCTSCVRHIDDALRELKGVASVDVRILEAKVAVRHDTKASIDRIVTALSEAGYEARPSAA